MWGSSLLSNYAKNGWSALKNGGSVISDAFSLGRSAYSSATGDLAHRGGTAMGVMGEYLSEAWKSGDTAIKAGMAGAAGLGIGGAGMGASMMFGGDSSGMSRGEIYKNSMRPWGV